MQTPVKLLTTAQVCQTLGLTPSKVRRLANEGYLEVSAKARQKYGTIHLFHPSQVNTLKQQMPRILSKWASEDNVRLDARKAGLRRALEPMNAKEVRMRTDEFLSSLDELPEDIAKLLRTSFYLYHLNHYAKSGHPYLYEIKERILKDILEEYQNSPCLQVIWIQGKQRSHLCSLCRNKANRLDLTYQEYAQIYEGCPKCRKQKNYYDLFEFNIQYGNHRFSFHTPFSVARKWLPLFNDSEIPRQHRGHLQEQGLTFGRPITEREARALPMEEVIATLEDLF